MMELVLVICLLRELELTCREQNAGREMAVYECVSQSQQLAAQVPLVPGEKIAKVTCRPTSRRL